MRNPTDSAVSDPQAIAQRIARVLAIESQAVLALTDQVGPEAVTAVSWIRALTGRLIVTGMGKSGHVAKKLAATFASTGTPAFFVHPAEAQHGDLGMLQPQEDMVLAISYSGETDEILQIAPHIKRMGIRLMAMTGRPDSSLARLADLHLNAAVVQEACPLNLAPTASTTAAMALGDALAVAVLESKGFSADDFARSHPGGSLGRRLLIRVADVMRTGEQIPRIPHTASLSAALMEMTRKRMGMTCVMQDAHRLAGIFTDGDLRRVLEQQTLSPQTPIATLMTAGGKTIAPDALASEAARVMDELRINHLLVVDSDGALLGAIGIHDLLEAKIL
ncbi:MAG: KpsF/GutQ family sugar-phosphate isomerase [Burkholderiaceae bacterium]|jgi:arabinose-5-phosphate isomerase